MSAAGYEYEVTSWDGEGYAVDHMNEMAKEGWRCINVQPTESSIAFYWEKPLDEMSPNIKPGRKLKVNGG